MATTANARIDFRMRINVTMNLPSDRTPMIMMMYGPTNIYIYIYINLLTRNYFHDITIRVLWKATYRAHQSNSLSISDKFKT